MEWRARPRDHCLPNLSSARPHGGNWPLGLGSEARNWEELHGREPRTCFWDWKREHSTDNNTHWGTRSSADGHGWEQTVTESVGNESLAVWETSRVTFWGQNSVYSWRSPETIAGLVPLSGFYGRRYQWMWPEMEGRNRVSTIQALTWNAARPSK